MSETRIPELSAREFLYARAQEASPSATAVLAVLAAGRLALQFAGIARYGIFRDELYYLACGEHLAWGYVDQPPLIAVVAWVARHALGGSLISIRLLPALAGAALVFLTGVFTRELGGGKFAQFLAAVSVLLAPAYLALDSFLSMNAFEPLFWLLCAWIALRILKQASAKLWLAFGALAGIGLENKHTMIVFGLALVVGLVVSAEWRVFRSKWIWIAGVIALLVFLPNLVWEARHGWPQIEVVRNAQLYKNLPTSPLKFMADQVAFLNPMALPVWIAGVVWLLFSREGRRFRAFGWAYLAVMTIFIVTHGKSYYALPIYPVVMAAGGVALERVSGGRARPWLRVAFPILLVFGGLVAVPFGVPVLPLDLFQRYAHVFPYAQLAKTERDAVEAPLPQLYADMFGWDTMARTVAGVYHSLPIGEQHDCAILGGNYGETGAIDYYGPALGLPKAIGGHNSYYYWGPRAYSGSCMIIFGERSLEFSKYFGEVRLAATIKNPHGMPIEQFVPVFVCREPIASLRVLWPRFKMII
jgi:hypothetical protein